MAYLHPLLSPGPKYRVCRCDRWYDEDGGQWTQIRLRCFHFESLPDEVQQNIREEERNRGWL